MEELKKCPFCDSDRGYYMLERVHRALLFNFDGDPIGGTEDVTDYAGRRKQCIDCDKILPRKLFEEVMEKVDAESSIQEAHGGGLLKKMGSKYEKECCQWTRKH